MSCNNFAYLEGTVSFFGQSTTATGKVVSRMSIRVSQGKGSGSFFDVEMWGLDPTVADTIDKNCSKYCKVAVQGKLRQDSWNDKSTGAKRTKVKVAADRINIVSLTPPKRDDVPDSSPKGDDAPF